MNKISSCEWHGTTRDISQLKNNDCTCVIISLRAISNICSSNIVTNRGFKGFYLLPPLFYNIS